MKKPSARHRRDNLPERFTATGGVNSGHAILSGICGAACLFAFGLSHLGAPRFQPIRHPGE